MLAIENVKKNLANIVVLNSIKYRKALYEYKIFVLNLQTAITCFKLQNEKALQLKRF